MTNKALVAVLVGIIVVLVGVLCFTLGLGARTPQSTVVQAFDCLHEGNLQGLGELYSPEALQDTGSTGVSSDDLGRACRGGTWIVKVENVEIQGNQATVNVVLQCPGGTQRAQCWLRKTSGTWRITSPSCRRQMESIMQIAITGQPPPPLPIQETPTNVDPTRRDFCDRTRLIDANGGCPGLNGIAALRWTLPTAVSPGQTVQSEVSWQFSREGWDGYNPNAVIHVNVFGDWQPDSELAHLINGERLGDPRSLSKSITFQAPMQPGVYRLRWLFITWYNPNGSFYGASDDPNKAHYPVAWSEVSFRVKQ